MSSVFDCTILELPRISSERGSLTSLTGSLNVPFDIRRVYYLYDIPGGSARGGHAHKALQQLLIAASGSFDVLLDDGVNKRSFHLNRPYYGLLIPTMIWREISNFSSGSVCLVLASHTYDESDYHRSYNAFQEAVRDHATRSLP